MIKFFLYVAFCLYINGGVVGTVGVAGVNDCNFRTISVLLVAVWTFLFDLRRAQIALKAKKHTQEQPFHTIKSILINLKA